MDVPSTLQCALATQMAIATGVSIDPGVLDLVGRVNKVSLGTEWPFYCQPAGAPSRRIWYSKASAEREISSGLQGCPGTQLAKCRDSIRAGWSDGLINPKYQHGAFTGGGMSHSNGGSTVRWMFNGGSYSSHSNLDGYLPVLLFKL